MYINILPAPKILSQIHQFISYEVLSHDSIPAYFTRNDWERFVLYMSIELFHNQYYCMIFKLPQSPAVFFWFCLYFLLLFFSWTGYNTSSSPIYHFKKTVNNAGSSFDEVRHARNFLCLVPSIIVNKALQLDDEVEGMLFWEKDNPFPKSFGNVLRWKTLWQSADGELLINSLLLALGACDEDRISQTSITGRPPSVSGGRCWLKSEQRSFVIYRRNTYEQYGGYNLFQNAEFKANFSINVWRKC